MTTTTKAAMPREVWRHAISANPHEIWRQEVLKADRQALEWEYFRHVILPLAERGYPRPKAQALLLPQRRYRWDYAWLAEHLAVEVQGGVWLGSKGGHSSAAGITRDAAKLNELCCIGWRCLFVTAAQIASGEALDWTERALRAPGCRPTRGE